jgi:RNA polymerase sigma factor (sigma-70 family)
MATERSGNSDAQLVEGTLSGDRSAFAAIVKRYQSLVCSVTYNATGSLSLSEDIAQETFLAAWKQLAELREPARLRSWLCSIARFLAGKELGRRSREPIHVAEPLDAVPEPASLEASPSAQAVSREEEAILWRALERIPETYREPLILFYREEKSIERVAAELELSEEAVKQRLARGRKMLHEQVVAFVEGTLSRTAPREDFSQAVLALLPAAPAAAAGAGTAAKGAALAKSGSLAWWLAPLASFIGVIAAMMTQWLAVRTARTGPERRFQKLSFIGLWIFALTWTVGGSIAVQVLRRRYAWSDPAFYRATLGLWWFYAIAIATFNVLWVRRVAAMRRQHAERSEILQSPRMPMAPGSSPAAAIGLYLASFSWLIGLAWHAQDRLWAGIVAGTMAGIITWDVLGFRGLAGKEAGRVAIGRTALIWGLNLLIVNLRLPVWLAAMRGSDLSAIHRLLPVWAIPLATLLLLGWIGLLLGIG